MISTSDIKTILRITGSDYDTYIAALIPVLFCSIVDYTGNSFITDLKNYGSSISFDADTQKMEDSEEAFSYFKDDDMVLVRGSLYNDGHFLVTTAIAASLTIDSGYPLVTEDSDTYDEEDVTVTPYVYRCFIPKGITLIMAQMVSFLLKKFSEADTEVSSEKLGDYSINYGTGAEPLSATDFPASIIRGLNAYSIVDIG